MNEHWKNIIGYENLYKISDTGKVFSIKRNRIVKSSPNKRGYQRVCLWKNRKKVSKCVHRLVIDQFIDNPNPIIFIQANHKDGNKTNNQVNNLEWCTASYNVKHAYNTGLKNCVTNRGINGKFISENK
jgi:hypothetical protein